MSRIRIYRTATERALTRVLNNPDSCFNPGESTPLLNIHLLPLLHRLKVISLLASTPQIFLLMSFTDDASCSREEPIQV